jgi:predicted PurR-regulated permease PerM
VTEAGEPGSQPDIKKLGEALRERIEIRSLSITGLFVLALFYTLYFAKDFFLPESQFLSPLILGKRLTLNPVAIFVGLVFWWWIWGVPGAFIAVTLIATFKIFCDHIEALAPIGEFLGR